MSFDGIFLHKMMPELKVLKTGRITKIMESGDTDFVFTIRIGHQNYNLFIGCSCDYARIHLTNKAYEFPTTPKALTMFLRKHIEGYFIEDLYQYGNDRIVVLKLTGYSEMKDISRKYLICEIMGRFSNLILTNEQFQILEVLKHTGVTEYGRTMLPNALYMFPKTKKKNPFEISLEQAKELTISSPKELCQAFDGICLGFAAYVFQKERALEYFYELLSKSTKPSIYNVAGKRDFYFLPLSEQDVKTYASLSELLDEFYYMEDKQAKIKLKTKDLKTIIEKHIIKSENKLQKLTKDLNDTSSADDYRLKGELLLSAPNLKAKEAQISIFNYYTNEEVLIPLDIKYDIITNSQRYFKKYQKMKASIQHINKQIQIATEDIEYFKLLLLQLEQAGIHDALEIRQELIDQHYILEDTQKQVKKPKPNYLTYLVDDVCIYVGKNNLQNEYVTHKLAKPNEYWFHVQNASGSHVILATNEFNESLCRTAAMLAANYSSLKDSSSIPVDYTQIRNIKKIPGKKGCFVTYTKQKTIYIDIDASYLESLRIKK